jgi:hypothetical protein
MEGRFFYTSKGANHANQDTQPIASKNNFDEREYFCDG